MRGTRSSFACIALAFAVACHSAPSEAGPWSVTGRMAYKHADGAAVALPNGTALMTGGLDQNHRPTFWVDADELYDPASGRWEAAGSLALLRHPYTATLLPSGRVLVAGDLESSSAELYSP